MIFCLDWSLRCHCAQTVSGPTVVEFWDPYKKIWKFTRKRKMLSNEIPRSAELKDGSKASWPRRPCPSPSQRRQLDNFNYSPTMEDLLFTNRAI